MYSLIFLRRFLRQVHRPHAHTASLPPCHRHNCVGNTRYLFRRIPTFCLPLQQKTWLLSAGASGHKPGARRLPCVYRPRQSQPIGTTLALSSPRRLFLVVDPQMEVEVSIDHAVCNCRCNGQGDGRRQRFSHLPGCLREPRRSVLRQPFSPRFPVCACVRHKSARARRAIFLNSNDRTGTCCRSLTGGARAVSA